MNTHIKYNVYNWADAPKVAMFLTKKGYKHNIWVDDAWENLYMHVNIFVQKGFQVMVKKTEEGNYYIHVDDRNFTNR